MMAEDLQGLLDRIRDDGLQKARSERETILAQAKAEAEKIVSAAKAEAEELRKKAETDAAESEKRAAVTIRQAARDIGIALKADLLARLRNVTQNAVDGAMTPQLMAQIVTAMAAAYAQNSAAGIEVILAKKDLEALETGLKASLRADLAAKTDICLGGDFSAGLKIGFRGSDVFFDFSDEALADVICEFVGPKLASVLKD